MYPILLKLGSLNIYSYGFFVIIGFSFGTILAIHKARKSDIRISFDKIVDLFFYSVLSAIIGSRILFVLINFDFYRERPLHIFHFWEGGLVFFGGFILSVGISIVYMKVYHMPIFKLADLVSPSIALGLFCGRIGCFLAGCCYGKETSLPWGVTFTNPNSLARLNVSLHPTQLYEAIGALAIFIFLSWAEKNKKFDGQIFFFFILLYSSIRFFIEIFRGDPRGFIFGDTISTSQGIGILLAIFAIFMLFYLNRRR